MERKQSSSAHESAIKAARFYESQTPSTTSDAQIEPSLARLLAAATGKADDEAVRLQWRDVASGQVGDMPPSDVPVSRESLSSGTTNLLNLPESDAAGSPETTASDANDVSGGATDENSEAADEDATGVNQVPNAELPFRGSVSDRDSLDETTDEPDAFEAAPAGNAEGGVATNETVPDDSQANDDGQTQSDFATPPAETDAQYSAVETDNESDTEVVPSNAYAGGERNAMPFAASAPSSALQIHEESDPESLPRTPAASNGADEPSSNISISLSLDTRWSVEAADEQLAKIVGALEGTLRGAARDAVTRLQVDMMHSRAMVRASLGG